MGVDFIGNDEFTFDSVSVRVANLHHPEGQSFSEPTTYSVSTINLTQEHCSQTMKNEDNQLKIAVCV